MNPKPRQLDTLDLNLLRVLDVLMQERKVASTAVRLGLSQPAVSNALARLRCCLGDELLIRTPAGMQPTAFAMGIHNALAPALASVEAALHDKAEFDPLLTKWQARLAMTDIGEIVFLPKLLELLAIQAPFLQLSTVRNTAIDLPAEMASGAVDLALGWLPDVPQGYFQRKLFKQHYVCLARDGHPIGKGKFTLAKFLSAKHISVLAQGTGHARAEDSLHKLGVKRNVVLQVPHFLSVPFLVAQSDLIVTVPDKLAQAAAAKFSLQILPHPVDIPPFQVDLFWHRRVHQEPTNQWLRGVVAKHFATLSI